MKGLTSNFACAKVFFHTYELPVYISSDNLVSASAITANSTLLHILALLQDYIKRDMGLNTFASRALAHKYVRKNKLISREEINKAVEEYKSKGGTITKLPALSDAFSQKLVSGSEFYKVYSWTFDSVRKHGVVKQDHLTNEDISAS